jgi:hypothetical protein
MTGVYTVYDGTLTDGQREGDYRMLPTELRTEHLERLRAQRAQVRMLADHHAALAQEFHTLHAQAQALQHQDDEVSRAERRAQIDALTLAEVEVLHQARHVRERLQRVLREHLWQPQEPQEPPPLRQTSVTFRRAPKAKAEVVTQLRSNWDDSAGTEDEADDIDSEMEETDDTEE